MQTVPKSSAKAGVTRRKITSTNFGNQHRLAQTCILNDTLYRIGMRWKMQVLYAIHGGVQSFGALKKALPGVSDHVLGRRLRELVAEGLIEKCEAGAGAGVADAQKRTYTATARGVALLAIMASICAWEAAG